MIFLSLEMQRRLLEDIIFLQIYHYPEVWYNRHVAAFFETSVLKEVHILYPLSPQ